VKIDKITTFILRVPLGNDKFYSSQAAFPERNSLLVKITTDDGLVGWGEGGQYGPPEPVATCINDVLAPLIVGQRASEPVRIWEKLYAFSRDFGQKGTYIEAISALDIALWDIWGKILDQPIYALAGGAFRSRVHAYATGCYYGENFGDREAMLAALEKEAASYVASGFDLLKIKIGLLSVEADAERIATVRSAVGSGIKLLVDANHAYNAATAVRMGRQLEKHDVLWFEEPVVPEDLAGYRRLRNEVTVRIAGGEAEFTRFGFLKLFSQECVDIAQPDLCVCGGFSEFLKIQALAGSFGILTIPHVWGSAIAIAAALHALAIIPPTPHTYRPIPLQNEPVVEYDRKRNPLRDELLMENFRLEDGCVVIPQKPGLGISVDEKVLQKYADGSR